MIKKAVAAALASGAAILALFALTNPETVPSVVLLLVFALLYVCVTALLLVLLVLLKRFGLLALRTKTIWRAACMLGGFMIFMVILRSIGQLTIRDVAISALFAVLLYIYYARLRMTAQDDE